MCNFLEQLDCVLYFELLLKKYFFRKTPGCTVILQGNNHCTHSTQVNLTGEDRSGDGYVGPGQGRREAAPEGAAGQHPGQHGAGHVTSGAAQWREAHLGAHLRGRVHLHRARPPQDLQHHGRRLRAQA